MYVFKEGMKIEEQLIENFLKTKYEDIPCRDIENAKTSIIDTIGVTLAGASFPGVEKLREQLLEWGGKKESTILGFGEKVPSTSAALINGTMARVLDFDEAHEKAIVHPSASIVPGCLSIAERIGNISGREFISAVVVGRDLVCRLALAPKRKPLLSGWMPSSTFGCLGGAVTVSKILGFDTERALNAMGIAYSNCSGNMQGYVEGAFTGAMQQGIGTSAGVFGAIMAERGLSGAHEVLEGKYGYFHVYENFEYDRNQLLEEFGKRFEGSNVSFKPYPCCRFTHGAIDIALNTIRSKKLKNKNVDEIEVRVNRQALDMVGDPIKKKQFPETIVDAKFSIPFTLAIAIIKGRVAIEDFSEKNLANKSLIEISQRTRVVLDEEIEEKFSRIVGPTVINIRQRDGSIISDQSEFSRGHPNNPMTREEILAKFKNCLKNSFKPFKDSKIEEILKTLENLERLENVDDLIGLLNFNR